MKLLGAAAVIINATGHVLLVRHSYGQLNWELPGGGAETGESAMEAAVREVHEETGLAVEVLYLTGTYYDREYDMHHFVFRCQPLDATALPYPASPEITYCAYWPPEALPRPFSDFTARRIADAMAGTRLPLPFAFERREWL